MSLFCNLQDLKTESDVEQKLIYPLLTSKCPIGLSYAPDNIMTKPKIKPQVIEKSNPKVHYPDYLITINGLPVLIIEAKKPGINVFDVFSEARLYANEVNAFFQHNINPCRRIVVINGEDLICGYNDQDRPQVSMQFKDLEVGNILFSEFVDFCCKDVLSKYCSDILKKVRGNTKYFRPVGEVGGKRAQNSELKENEFGRTIALKYSNILSPDSENDFKDIVENAYVKSQKREQHIEPILKTIRSIKLPSIDNSIAISSKELNPFFDGIKSFLNVRDRVHSLIILIGNVGSGKSTFIRYIKDVAIKKEVDLENSLHWIIINMNNAPVSENEVYTWLRRKVIENIKLNDSSINFGNQEFLKNLYQEDIKEFEHGLGSFLEKDSADYNKELYNLIKSSIDDEDKTLKRLLYYSSVVLNKEPILVLDNVDKRNSHTQLLLFQVAEWFRSEYKCLVILPLRDTTYDMYKSTPPLDTVIKDLVFRIDPPDLLTVLQYRLKYLYYLDKNNNSSTDYPLTNGIKVKLSKNDHLEYFKYVLTSIRQNNLVKNIFYSITGRDIRSGIELFIRFCKSGYLASDDFFEISATQGEYIIPNHMMMNAILRGNRVFYSDKESNIKNLFASDFSDEWVDPFARVDILIWLNDNKSVEGSSGAKGFHKIQDLITALSVLGHSANTLLRECSFLNDNRLIISESQGEFLSQNDLIRISQFGILHLHLLNNITYLSACSEDVLYKNLEITKKISDRITNKTGDGQLSKTTIIHNVEDMLNYLSEYRSDYLARPSQISTSCDRVIYNLDECYNALDKAKLYFADDLHVEQLENMFKCGDQVECMVVCIKEYGIFVSIDLKYDGFISKDNMKGYKPTDFEIADIIKANVIEYRKYHRRFQLDFVTKLLD